MYRTMKVSVVIPCYDEEDGIRHVIGSLPGSVDEVIVVDNNSTDRTAEVAVSLGAKVIKETRMGYGSAYKAGLPAVSGDITVTMDGDGSYPTEQIEELIDHLIEHELDFVSACRFPLKNPESMSFTSKLGNFVLTVAMLLLYGKGVRDSQSGMWVFRSKIYKTLNPRSDGMAFSEEIKIQAIRAKNVQFDEYPVVYHQRIGKAKLQAWRDGFKNLFFLLKKRFS
jgi:glycosyltransferase involved in cell wall biosynthesis